MFKVCRRNVKLYNFELECGFRSLICFVVPMYTNMAWNPAEMDYFTLIENTIITVQYIQDVWMINIHTIKESESENIVKCVYLDIFIFSKASSIAFASDENI